MIASIVLLAAVVGICLLIISGSRPRRGETTLHARHFAFLRRYADRSMWPSLIIGAIAAGTLTAAGAIDAGEIGVGLILGLTCAVLWRLGLRVVTEWSLALISLAAAIVDVIALSAMPASAATELVRLPLPLPTHILLHLRVVPQRHRLRALPPPNPHLLRRR
jgi:hypothetical protein